MNEASAPLIAAGGRKYTIALVAVAALLLSRACSWIDGAQLLDGLKSVLLLYGGANVGQKLVDAVSGAIASKAAATATKTPA